MSATTARATGARTTAPRTEGRLDRMGIPRPLALGFVAVLVFMTGNGVESNFITPHMVAVLGSPEATVATIVTFYSLAALIGSYISGALSDLVGPRRVMILGFAVWVVFEVLFLLALGAGSVPFAAVTYALRGFGYPLCLRVPGLGEHHHPGRTERLRGRLVLRRLHGWPADPRLAVRDRCHPGVRRRHGR
ncbi:MFS transporter [Curtobacterium flaccumfaciens]|uniref:MFS transporter n=1 Tax=Curtobacterium flaccumfaciens TaxID=2035 RepID=UPI0021C90CA1|nr:MFS transporter [Curtobacterium flaccumfaciens]UXN23183.1 MFS transporter [Curtobacterium flaccumfaciens pv. flaccumfaciens]